MHSLCGAARERKRHINKCKKPQFHIFLSATPCVVYTQRVREIKAPRESYIKKSCDTRAQCRKFLAVCILALATTAEVVLELPVLAGASTRITIYSLRFFNVVFQLLIKKQTAQKLSFITLFFVINTAPQKYFIV